MKKEQRNKIKELREQGNNTNESNLKVDIAKQIGRVIKQGVQV